MKYGKFPEQGKAIEPPSGVSKGLKARNALRPSALVAAVAMALGSGSAWADNCSSSSSITSSGITCTSATDAAELTVTGATVNAAGTGILVSSTNGGTSSLTLTDSSITANPSTAMGGILVYGNVSDNSITLNGNNTLNFGPNADTAVQAGAGTGNSTVTVNGTLNLTNAGASNTADGLEASSTAGNVTINHHGNGTIDVAGGHALFAITGGTGIATIVADGGAVLKTTGSNSSTIQGISNTLVSIQSNADIHAAGQGSIGIEAQTGLAGQASITNSGTVNAAATGIQIFTNGGDAVVNNSGNVSGGAGQYLADGIHVNSGAHSTINDLNGSTITATQGGISSRTRGQDTNTTVNSNSRIIVDDSALLAATPSHSLIGIDNFLETANLNSLGNAVVVYDGTSSGGITLTGNHATTDSLIGIRSYVEQGNLGHADITASGDITVSKLSGSASGYFVYGIEAISRGEGNSLIKYNGGTLTVTDSVTSGSGTTGFGLVSWSDGGSASVSTGVGTSVNTIGESVTAIHVSAGTDGDAVAITNSTISTNGDTAHGVSVASNLGNATIVNTGDISLSGEFADGLLAQVSAAAGLGKVSVGNQGDITSLAGSGINAYNAGTGDVLIANEGDITAGVHAIAAGSASGKVEVSNSGALHGTGVNYAGIYINAGGVSLLDNAGDITTDAGTGIFAMGQDAITIIHREGAKITSNVQDGLTTAAMGYGSAIHTGITNTASTGDVNVYAYGDAETFGSVLPAYAIYADNHGSGNVLIDAKGQVINHNTVADSAALRAHSHNAAGDVAIRYENDTDALSISTVADRGHGIHASSSGGDTTVNVVKANLIQTAGEAAHGIVASATGAGKVNVLVEDAVINVSGADSAGILAVGDSDVTVVSNAEINNDALGVSASMADGISIGVSVSGDATVIAQNDITLDGGAASAGSHGILADHGANSTGDNKISYSNGTILTKQNEQRAIESNHYGTAGSIRIENSGTLTTLGDNSTGIATRVGNATGSITILNTGEISTQGNGSGFFGSHAMAAQTYGGDITIQNEGALSTKGNDVDGIWANVATAGVNGTITITNKANIATHGDNSRAIAAHSEGGDIVITNVADIRSSGDNAMGIYANVNNGGDVTITNTGEITTTDEHGILGMTASGNVSIVSLNNITTSQANGIRDNHGLEAKTNASGKASVEHDNGTIKVSGNTAGGGNSIAIAAWDNGSNATDVDGYIHLGANSLIDATQGVGGLFLGVSGTGTIDIDTGAQVHGGANDGYGVKLTGVGSTANHTVNNHGVIDAMSDNAITGSIVGGSALIENYGTVTGYMTFANGTAVTFNNYSPNSFDIRNFADTDGDGVRDTKGVAISTFGGASSIFNNAANGVVRLVTVSGEQFVNTSGQYLADGLSHYDTSRSGIVQGQMLNLGSFTNSGAIDLSQNGLTGDTLVISGSGTAGANGGGQFVSDGGVVKMDTVVNRGGSSTQSDILVVDNATASGAPTVLALNTLKGQVGLSEKEGIKLVEVLGTSDANAFTLGQYVENGPFEYGLFRGSLTNAADQSWYLRNYDENGRPMFRATVGAYLANQTAATGLFVHSLHDRLGEPQFTHAYKDGYAPSVWLRIVGNHTDSKAADGLFDQDTDSSLVHLGGELANWTSNGDDRWHVGVMGAYGQSETDSTLQRSGKSSTGKIEGYSLGAYATWYANQNMKAPTGLYLDGWMQYSWFDNTVSGGGDPKESYNSKVMTASLESGYAFVAHDAPARQWIIEPQAQVVYSDYRADSVTDSRGMRVDNGDADSVMTRLGVRTYSRSTLGDNAFQPFVEANWLYNNAKNTLDFNGYTVKDGMPKNRYEVKVGVQGEIVKGLQVWGHFSGTGGEQYGDYGGTLGVKKTF
ncbi:autotransporter outer membrane beta-barrel domain-containing protein [Leminorella grimontii]|uniref:autotransporter outer membrane beta-barrel domain-containing protein n=1 Tax=Leminorella grimontii TaxID=82981 RepID=UPI00321F68BB